MCPEVEGPRLARSIVSTVDGNKVFRWVDAESSQVATPSDVTAGLAGALTIDVQGGGGLREPQRGALFATLAHWTTGRNEPANVVMPTGTGKTEAMIALFAADRAERLLVLVPSDALRRQISDKFGEYGVLPRIGVLAEAVPLPFVGRLEHRLKTVEAAVDFARACNVVVATPGVLLDVDDEVLQALLGECSHLFVDEAHHVAAKSWQRIRDAFAGHRVVQFTATPFRTDGKRLGGRTVYEFPLKEAQRLGYFARINYVGLAPTADDDRAIAVEAIRRLRDDLAKGYDHLLMARAKTRADAELLHVLYVELASDLSPRLLHSGLPKSQRTEAVEAIQGEPRTSRVIVCVDMLGEGFDLPELKVAALHDVHKTLGVTLQFVGRFARTVPGATDNGQPRVGEATVVAARVEGQLDDNLRRLYREDSDWNELIRDLSAQRLREEEEVEEFERGFRGESDIPTQGVQPKMSTVVFRTDCEDWNLDALAKRFPPETLLTDGFVVNHDRHVLWFITETRTEARWGEHAAGDDVVHDLYVMYWNEPSGTLYINCSANQGHYVDEAKALCGESVRLIRGHDIYRAMARIRRPTPTNVGLLDVRSRNRRHMQLSGANVTEGFPTADAQTKTQTNIFVTGFEHGERATVGAGVKGRVWSYQSAPTLKHWLDWCDHIGAKLRDTTINVDELLAGFIKPVELNAWPELVSLAVEWPYDTLPYSGDGPVFEVGDDRTPLLLTDIGLRDFTPTPPVIEVSSAEWTAEYQVELTSNGLQVTPLGPDPIVRTTRSATALSEWLNRYGFRLLLEQDCVIEQTGTLYRPDATRPPYEVERLRVVDWKAAGVNIRRESQRADRDTTSIQAHMIGELARDDSWEVILDDDGKGEIADIVGLKADNIEVTLRLVHCKFSSSDKAGCRLGDLYELCGQAQRSARRRLSLPTTIDRLIARERGRMKKGKTGLERGTLEELYRLRDLVDQRRGRLEVVIVQPGLSRSVATAEALSLLASTESYVADVADGTVEVVCSS